MLQEDFPDLSKIYNSDSLMPGMFAMDRQEGAQRSQQLNQAGFLQKLYQDEQMNPLLVRQQQLQNDTSLAQLPGFTADSSLKQDKAKLSRETMELQLTAQQKKLLGDASDDDVKLLENAAQNLAYSNDPTESAKGQKLLQLHKLVIQEKSKQKYMSDRQVELEKLRGKNTMDLAKENNAAGRYKKGQGSVTIEEQLKSGKLSYEKAAVLLGNSAYMAELDGDDEKAAQYRALANQYAAKVNEARAAGNLAPKAGTPNLDNLGVQTNPSIPATPLSSPMGASAAPTVQQPDIKAMVQQAGGQYEPDKYEYRVVNGKVQRRAK